MLARFRLLLFCQAQRRKGGQIILNLAPEVHVAVFAPTDRKLGICREACSHMKLLVRVALDLHEDAARHNIYKADAAVVRGYHGDDAVQKVYASYFSSVGKLPVLVLHVNLPQKL